MHILSCGEQALLIELDSGAQVASVSTALEKLHHPGFVDVVPAASTVLVTLDTHTLSIEAAYAMIEELDVDAAESASAGRTVEIPVHYDGADLEELAASNNVRVAELIEWHTSTQWRASFGGFAPGFMYLSPVNAEDAIDIARRSSPRTEIPAGSVALAGTFSAVYPKSSPGGWQLLGTTTARMWDLTRTQPSLITPGDRVRFRQVRA